LEKNFIQSDRKKRLVGIVGRPGCNSASCLFSVSKF